MSEINQELSNIASESNRSRLMSKSLRRARARTLIQVGSLLGVVGYFPFCGIEEGDDLQFDIESRDKAAILLGILSDAFNQLPNEPSTEKLEHWKSTGVRIMKMRKSNL